MQEDFYNLILWCFIDEGCKVIVVKAKTHIVLQFLIELAIKLVSEAFYANSKTFIEKKKVGLDEQPTLLKQMS